LKLWVPVRVITTLPTLVGLVLARMFKGVPVAARLIVDPSINVWMT
jgi:hypothetical protein